MKPKEKVPRSVFLAGEPEPPSISVIVPLFNGEKYIHEALSSVLAQTLQPQEVIVVDDGSRDQGPQLVRRLIGKLPITLFQKPNGGQSSARNFGVAHASGELVAFLDQDDVWYPQHLEEMVKPFLDPPYGAELGWVYSNLDEVDDAGLMICHRFLSTLWVEHPKRTIFSCLGQDMFVLPSASLVRRKAFEAVGGFDERLSGYEDDDLFLRLFRAGYANVYIDSALSKWRIYPDSSSYTSRMRRSRMIYAKKLLEGYPDDPRRNRYYARDVILPRFYSHAITEYRNALKSHDLGAIKETRNDLAFLVRKMPIRRRPRGGLGRTLIMARSLSMSRMVFAVLSFAGRI